MALERYERRGKARREALDELRARPYKYVAFHTESNQWFVLDFDLKPVLPPDDEEKYGESDQPLFDDVPAPAPEPTRVPVTPTPAATLQLLAQRAHITIPVTGSVKKRLALLDDPRVVSMLQIVGRRGMHAQDAAHILFDPVNGELRTAVKKVLDIAPKT